jgi:uncharacterized protein (TIGR00255 family)
MTGFGDAHSEADDLTVRAEIRSVNNRHLKLSCRVPDGYGALEPRLETLVRQEVRRGAIQLNLLIERAPSAQDYQINLPILANYFRQMTEIHEQLAAPGDVHLDSLLALPGVVQEATEPHPDLESEWPLIEKTVRLSLERLGAMRQREGEAMEADLRANCRTIQTELEQIRSRVPQIVQAYQARLTERLNSLLEPYDLQIEPSDILKEVGLFSDRMDIAEETVRLASHLDQFESILATENSAGRKLDFLIQEMLRETNTIGSKAGDAQTARHVVQIKTNIERLREMVQNIE